MKSNYLQAFFSCGALVVALFTQTVSAQHYAIQQVMSGLDNPRGLAFGPDGGLYVAEAGRGGTTPTGIVIDGQPRMFGSTGAVSRLIGGAQQRVLTGLPSLATSGGAMASGLHDIVFSAGGEAFGVIGLGTTPRDRASLCNAGANFGNLVDLH
jgi:hypothetical protein